MSNLKMSDANVLYLLQTLSGFEPEDIEQDDFDVAVNDEQFSQMSIVRTAELGAELIAKQAKQLALLNDALSKIIKDSKFYYQSSESVSTAKYGININNKTAHKALAAATKA